MRFIKGMSCMLHKAIIPLTLYCNWKCLATSLVSFLKGYVSSSPPSLYKMEECITGNKNLYICFQTFTKNNFWPRNTQGNSISMASCQWPSKGWKKCCKGAFICDKEKAGLHQDRCEWIMGRYGLGILWTWLSKIKGKRWEGCAFLLSPKVWKCE